MNIAVLLFHEVHELEAIGPYSVLRTALRFVAEDGDHRVFTVAKSRNSVETSGGLVMTPHWAFASAPTPDVLVVPGGRGVDAACRDKASTGYLNALAPRLRLLASVGSGSLILGELGLIRDLRATTTAHLRDRLLDYEVGEIVDARVVKNDGGIWCAGGVTAGLDLGLELARELFGQEAAERAAAEIDAPTWKMAPAT